MYESLHGRLARKEPSAVVVETAGIGYRVAIPLGTFETLPRPGEEVRLLLHLVVREDEWRLFGFATESERLAFRTLLKVSGVGPGLALAVLGGVGPDALARAVRDGDVRALMRIKGVGRKTAERIAVDLKDAWGERGPLAPGTTSVDDGPVGQAMRALEALGHAPDEARRRVDAVRSPGDGGDADVATLVRAALRI